MDNINVNINIDMNINVQPLTPPPWSTQHHILDNNLRCGDRTSMLILEGRRYGVSGSGFYVFGKRDVGCRLRGRKGGEQAEKVVGILNCD